MTEIRARESPPCTIGPACLATTSTAVSPTTMISFDIEAGG
jgi:hypothetical protein